MGLKTRKAAEVAAKQQVNVEADVKKHLLVKMGADRNVREAYLNGLVFAGLANDDEAPEIQSEERSVLDEICASLEVGLSLVDEIVAAEKASIDDDTYKDLLRECLVLFSDIKMYDAFLEDFDKVWSVGKGNPAELKSWHNDFEEMVPADVAKVLAERKSVEAKKVEEENAKRAAAEKARQAKLEAERQKKMTEEQYHQLQGLVQDWISTKRVTQDILITVKERLKSKYSSVAVQTVFRETCKQLIERVVEFDRNAEELEDQNSEKVEDDSGGFLLRMTSLAFSDMPRKGRSPKSNVMVEKIALETTWIVICLVLLKCKVSDLKIKTINELLQYARHEDFSDGMSLSFFWRNPNGLGDYDPQVEDFFVKVTGLGRVWDEVSDELLSMTEKQKQQLHEWRSERKRYKLEDMEAFAASIGVNCFMLYHCHDTRVMRMKAQR